MSVTVETRLFSFTLKNKPNLLPETIDIDDYFSSVNMELVQCINNADYDDLDVQIYSGDCARIVHHLKDHVQDEHFREFMIITLRQYLHRDTPTIQKVLRGKLAQTLELVDIEKLVGELATLTTSPKFKFPALQTACGSYNASINVIKKHLKEQSYEGLDGLYKKSLECHREMIDRVKSCLTVFEDMMVENTV